MDILLLIVHLIIGPLLQYVKFFSLNELIIRSVLPTLKYLASTFDSNCLVENQKPLLENSLDLGLWRINHVQRSQ